MKFKWLWNKRKRRRGRSVLVIKTRNFVKKFIFWRGAILRRHENRNNKINLLKLFPYAILSTKYNHMYVHAYMIGDTRWKEAPCKIFLTHKKISVFKIWSYKLKYSKHTYTKRYTRKKNYIKPVSIKNAFLWTRNWKNTWKMKSK